VKTALQKKDKNILKYTFIARTAPSKILVFIKQTHDQVFIFLRG
jgi:hypothetical protein